MTDVETIRQNNNLELYPNPASDFLHISLSLDESTTIRIDILDNMGRIRKSRVEEILISGNTKIYFETGDLPPGIYFLKIFNIHNSTTSKFLIRR
jgi:hypothetical protein